MPTQIELLQEAKKRGILPADKVALYDEAVRRGLIPEERQSQWKQTVSNVARPVLELGGMAAGGLAAAPTGPVGAVAGGALGYGMGKKGADLLDEAMGLKESPSMAEGVREIPGLVKQGVEMELLGRGAGKVLGAGAKAVGAGGKALLGKLTGAGPGAFEEAVKAGPEFTAAMRGRVRGQDIVENAKGALQSVRDARAEAYLGKLKEIGGDTTPIDLAPIRSKLKDLMKQYHVTFDKKGMIDTSRIAMGKKGRNEIESVIETIESWGTKEGDNTIIGLDTLKRQLDDFYSESSQARAFVQALNTSVKQTANSAMPLYGEMTKGYAEMTSIIKDFESGLMLRKQGMTGRVVADQTLRRLMSAMRESSGLRKELLDQLTGVGGKELSQQTAGYTLSGVLPIGLAGTGPAIMGEAALAKLVSPWFWPAISMSSPRVAGEFVQFIGRAGRLAKKAAPGASQLAKPATGYGIAKVLPHAKGND